MCVPLYGLAAYAAGRTAWLARLAGWLVWLYGSCGTASSVGSFGRTARLARLASWFVLDGAAGTAGLALVRSDRLHVGGCRKVQVEVGQTLAARELARELTEIEISEKVRK